MSGVAEPTVELAMTGQGNPGVSANRALTADAKR